MKPHAQPKLQEILEVQEHVIGGHQSGALVVEHHSCHGTEPCLHCAPNWQGLPQVLAVSLEGAGWACCSSSGQDVQGERLRVRANLHSSSLAVEQHSTQAPTVPHTMKVKALHPQQRTSATPRVAVPFTPRPCFPIPRSGWLVGPVLWASVCGLGVPLCMCH